MTEIERAGFKHHPYYCEENIWWLVQEPVLADKDPYALVIGPEPGEKSFAFWRQRVVPEHLPVFWDYHVVAVVALEGRWCVLDFDTRMDFATPLQVYFGMSAPPTEPPTPPPRVRMMTGAAYVATLRSDRSHMRDDNGHWMAPPPAWRAISDGESNVLALADMSKPTPGEVCDLAGVRLRLG